MSIEQEVEQFAREIINFHGFRFIEGFACIIPDQGKHPNTEGLYLWGFSEKRMRFETKVEKFHAVSRIKRMEEMLGVPEKEYKKQLFILLQDYLKSLKEIGFTEIGKGVNLFGKAKIHNLQGDVKLFENNLEVLKKMEQITLNNPILAFVEEHGYFDVKNKDTLVWDASFGGKKSSKTPKSAKTPKATKATTPKTTATKTPKTTPAKASKATPAKASKATPAKAPKATPAKASKAAKTPKATPAKASKATPAKTSKATPAKTSKATPAKTSKATPAKASKATAAKTSKATPAKTSKATPAKTSKATPAKASKATAAKASKATAAKASKATAAKASKATPAKTLKATVAKTSKATAAKASKATAAKTPKSTPAKASKVTAAKASKASKTTNSSTNVATKTKAVSGSISKTALADKLKKLAEGQPKNTPDEEARKKAWVKQVNALYKKVETWLSEHSKVGHISFDMSSVSEDNIGRYEVESFELNLVGNHQVIFEPVERNILGAVGRIDVYHRGYNLHKVMLLLHDEGKNKLQWELWKDLKKEKQLAFNKSTLEGLLNQWIES